MSTPALTATVHTGQKEHFVSFFQPTDKPNEAYAITSANQPIYKISPGILRGLPKRTFDLQDKRLFGLETQGRIESILTSHPPITSWIYNWSPEPDTPEAELYEIIKPKDWVNVALAK